MSDISGPTKIITAHWEHYCSYPGCTAWGAYGSPGPRGETVWRCQEHDPNGGKGWEGRAREGSTFK